MELLLVQDYVSQSKHVSQRELINLLYFIYFSYFDIAKKLFDSIFIPFLLLLSSENIWFDSIPLVNIRLIRPKFLFILKFFSCSLVLSVKINKSKNISTNSIRQIYITFKIKGQRAHDKNWYKRGWYFWNSHQSLKEERKKTRSQNEGLHCFISPFCLCQRWLRHLRWW